MVMNDRGNSSPTDRWVDKQKLCSVESYGRPPVYDGRMIGSSNPAEDGLPRLWDGDGMIDAEPEFDPSFGFLDVSVHCCP